MASQQADLQKMAETTLAVAQTTPYYAPKKDEAGKPIKDWLKFSEDMKKQSKDLIAAVKSGDPKTVQKAALTLNSRLQRLPYRVPGLGIGWVRRRTSGRISAQARLSRAYQMT